MATSPTFALESLRLQPFDPATAPGALELEASLRRLGPRLQIRWILSGDLSRLRLPEPQPQPQRRDELWTSTCLECFWARPGEPGYWELNLSPSGDWNLYRLDGYRQGLRPEVAIQSLSSHRLGSALGAGCALELAVELDLGPLLGAEASRAALELGVTAVLATSDDAISYWALVHPAPEADFHHRAGWCVRLPGPQPPEAQPSLP